MVEDLTTGEGFERSRALTDGYRWWVFLLVMVYIFLEFLMGAAALSFIPASQGGLGTFNIPGEDDGFGLLVFYSAIYSVSEMANLVIVSSGIAALYYELRHVKEGMVPESIAAVFD